MEVRGRVNIFCQRLEQRFHQQCWHPGTWSSQLVDFTHLQSTNVTINLCYLKLPILSLVVTEALRTGGWLPLLSCSYCDQVGQCPSVGEMDTGVFKVVGHGVSPDLSCRNFFKRLVEALCDGAHLSSQHLGVRKGNQEFKRSPSMHNSLRSVWTIWDPV